MALFQPTYVFPDQRNGLGQGTVDAANDLTVSWHVTGSSAMVAFQIVIYQNNAASTQVYTTGKINTSAPFYGTSASGEMRFFSHTITAAALASAGMVNGAEYKLVITQWWSADDSVTQSSASAFITRATPTLSISSIGTVTTRYNTFTGNYAQAQGDALNWLRWEIAVEGDEETPLYDSGEISGTMELSVYYDGFFTNTDYVIRLSIQTENGIEKTTGWIPFSVEYETSSVAGLVTARCESGTNAVYVEWSNIGQIEGTATGNYTISDGVISLPSVSYVTWDEVSGNPMSLEPPWSAVCKALLENADMTLFSFGQSGGNLLLSYSYQNGTLTLRKGETTLASQSGIVNLPAVTVVLTPTTLYLRSEYEDGGLYPSDSLYPGDSLYPAEDAAQQTDTYQIAVSYTQSPISSVQVFGQGRIDYLEIIKGTASEQVVTDAITDGDYVPGSGSGDYFSATFTDGLAASNLDTEGQTLTGYSLYRRQREQNALQHVQDLPLTSTGVYDYGVNSQQGPYTYYLFLLSAESFVTQPLVSESVSPCFWDWTLMECRQTDDENVYTVLAEYRFGKNLSSGSIGNNSKPNLLKNFTRFPTVQLAPQNYKSGTLKSLIGHIDYTNGAAYYDTIELMEKIYALSTTENPLFLKNRKGQMMKIHLTDATEMQTMDNTREQAQTVSLAWTEVAEVEGISLVAAASAAQGVEA